MAYFYRDLKLGILGGGQLGRMLIQAAIDFNIHIRVMDPAADAPCRYLAHEFVQGKLTDYQAVMDFGAACDYLTIEIEAVNTQALQALQQAGKQVYPDPEVIGLIQDKRLQKLFYAQNGLPTAPFNLLDSRKDAHQYVDMLPAVNKLGRSGYDGRGVQLIRSPHDLDKVFDAPGVLEQFVEFEKELAIIVARNLRGEVRCFPLVEMV
ncbi:MAG: ATP-grasp domain-containing protein, partial [Bacteroidetes bacterium]